MNQASQVYLTDDKFPVDIWDNIINLFSAQDTGLNKWTISTEEGEIDLCLKRVHESQNYTWEVSIYCQTPCTLRVRWLSLSIPYHCLFLIDNAIYHTPFNNQKFNTADDIENFAHEHLIKDNSLQKLQKSGLLDSNEKVKLRI